MNTSKLLIEIKTNYQKGFHWVSNENIWFIGYFYDSNDKYLTGIEALNILAGKIANPKYEDQITSLNGVFSIIIKFEDKMVLSSDKTRFFPIFYSQINGKTIVSDDFYYLLENQSTRKFNNKDVVQFLSGAFVSGSDTLVSNIHQVRPSELVKFSDTTMYQKYTNTFSVRTEDMIRTSETELGELAYEKFQFAGKRLADSLKNKKVILPLSGGYDSRLVACWLKENNIQDVTCFTFGRKNTPDISVSQKVAKSLGFDWYYVEYNEKMVGNYFHTEEFKEYYLYASRGTSMFYMQEYFAMLELREKGILGDNFVAIPGHSGDFLGGSQLIKVIPPEIKISNPEKILFSKSFWQQNIDTAQKEMIISLLKNQIDEIRTTFSSNADYSILEDWLIKERIIKYVFNSSQIFTFFGGEVRFPFWDNNLYEFWKNVPFEHRVHKKLYNKVLREKYFTPNSIDFGNQLQPNERDIFLYKIKSAIKQKLPYALKDRYRKKNDWVLYDEITQPMLRELKESGIHIPDNGYSYLHRILNWYLLRMEKEFYVSK